MFKDKAVFEAAIQEDNYKLKDGKKTAVQLQFQTKQKKIAFPV